MCIRDRDVTLYRGMLAPKIVEELLESPELVGEPTDARFGEDELIHREASMGRTAFLMQYLLNTELSDEERYPLKLRDLVVMDLDDKHGPERVIYASGPDYTDIELPNMGFRSDRWQKPVDIGGNWVKYEEVICAIDPSGRGADECAYVVVAKLAGALFVLDWGGYLDGYSEDTLTCLAQTAYQYGVNRIVAEANYGDGMWTRLFRPYLERYHARCTISEEKVTGRKEDRMLDILEPLWQQHRIVVNRGRVQSEIDELERRNNPGANASYNLFSQATHLCREQGALAHDDRLDALALAAWWYSESLVRSQNQEYEKRMEDAFDKSLKDFSDAYDKMRGPSQEAGWLSSGLTTGW